MTQRIGAHFEHFEDMQKQAHAARLGMWIFLGSEVLFFSGLFALYAAYRTEHPYGFGVGVEHNTIVFGSINTAVLLLSSYTVAMAVHMLRGGKHRAAARLVGATILLGLAFLVIKTAEYLKHFREGIYPGGWGSFFQSHGDAGTKMFFTLYYCMTGLHALHVFAGMCVLGFLLWKIKQHDIGVWSSHPLAVGAVYWHLVDVIWIFLWPLFYLVPGAVSQS
jgi:cytochrome c oxidase subunit 3